MFITLLIIVIVLVIYLYNVDSTPACYTPNKTKKCCTGDGCCFKYDCELYENYIKDE